MLGFVSMPAEHDPDPGPAWCRAVGFYEMALDLVEHPDVRESFAVNHDHALQRLVPGLLS